MQKNKVWKGTGGWKRQGRERVCCCFKQAVSRMPGWGDVGDARGFQAEKMLSAKACGQERRRGFCEEQSE